MNLRSKEERTLNENENTGCVVLSLSGEHLGKLGGFSGDRFRLVQSDGTSLWISSKAIYVEHPFYLELGCLKEGLWRYALEPTRRGPARRSEHASTR